MLNSHYYPILHECMNTRIGREKFKSFWILLGSGCSSTIVLGVLVEIILLKTDDVMQCHTQAGNITSNLKVQVYFTLPALSAMNSVTWNCHLEDSAKGRYDMIFGPYILTELGLNLRFSEHIIEADDGPLKGSTTPMVDLGMYIFILKI